MKLTPTSQSSDPSTTTASTPIDRGTLDGLSRRRFLSLAGAASAGAVLAACTPGSFTSSGGGSNTKTPNGILVINFFTSEDDPNTQAAAMQSIAAFEKAHPNTHVSMILMSADERDQRVLAGLSAGQDMGVFEVTPYTRSAFVDGGYLYPLDSVMKAIGVDQFAPSTRTLSNGHDWLFPYATAPHALWGRRDRVANIPTTWDDFLAAAKSNTGNGSYGAGFAIGTALAFVLGFPQFIWSQGADYFDIQGNVIFGSDQARQGIQNYVDLMKYSPPNNSNWAVYENINAYYSGRCAMAHFNGRLGDNLHAGAPQLEAITWAAHLPAGPVSAGITAVSYLGVDAKGANPELAAEFIRFMMTGDNGVAYASSVPGLLTPSVKSVRDAAVVSTSNPILQKHSDWFKVLDAEIATAIDVAGPMGQMATGSFKPYPGPGCPWASSCWGPNPIDMQMMQKIVLTGMSVKNGQAWAVDQYKGIVKDYKNKHPNWKPFAG